MNDTITELGKHLIDKLPIKFVVVVLSIVLVWFGILTAVALFTHHSVDFFPPHIGTDASLVRQFSEIKDELAGVIRNEQEQRDKLITNLENARERSIRIQQSGNTFGSTDAAIAVHNSEAALEEEEKHYLSTVRKIDTDIQAISAKL